MRKILLTLALISGIFLQAYSQCTVSNLAVHLKSVDNTSGQCVVKFDLSWNQEINNGNEFAYVHLWNAAIYPALEANGLAYTNSSDYPDAGDLSMTLATIVILENHSPDPSIGTVYLPAPGVTVLSEGLSVIKEKVTVSLDRMTVRNIEITLPDCNGVELTGDIWASQASNGHNPHCVSSDVSFIVGNPVISGSIECTLPRQYSVDILNKSSVPVNVSYNIYIDEGDAVYEPLNHDMKINEDPIGPFALSPGANYQSGLRSYEPYSGTAPYANRGLWVEVITEGFPNKTVHYIPNTCDPLSVSFGNFSASRLSDKVVLLWQTESEENNSGFEVQRKIGNNNFQTLGFTPSRAIGGNSDGLILYNFTDFNPASGIMEYRLKQIDYDGRFEYSKIVAVRGVNTKGDIVIYPNPAVNNTIKMLFTTDGRYYDVCLIDMAGRKIADYHKVNSQNLIIYGIPQGVYFVRVTDLNTKVITTQKVVVLN